MQIGRERVSGKEWVMLVWVRSRKEAKMVEIGRWEVRQGGTQWSDHSVPCRLY